MYSMTGYASKIYELGDYTLEIGFKALNNKFLDIRFKLPFSIEYLEEKMRKILKKYVKRGKVEISIKLTANEQLELTLITSMVDKYYKIIKKIQNETNSSFRISLSEMFSMKGLINPYEDWECKDIPEEVIEEIFVSTIEAFQESRHIEGENTKKEILKNIQSITTSLDQIAALSPSVVDRYKDQLKEKIRELIENQVEETRLMMEVVIFANKVDISEEISRINGHIQKMLSTIHCDEACGRELDFIIQELNREINTIGSKMPDYSVSEEVVNVKSCLEKIKEQVRNIE